MVQQTFTEALTHTPTALVKLSAHKQGAVTLTHSFQEITAFCAYIIAQADIMIVIELNHAALIVIKRCRCTDYYYNNKVKPNVNLIVQNTEVPLHGLSCLA